MPVASNFGRQAARVDTGSCWVQMQNRNVSTSLRARRSLHLWTRVCVCGHILMRPKAFFARLASLDGAPRESEARSLRGCKQCSLPDCKARTPRWSQACFAAAAPRAPTARRVCLLSADCTWDSNFARRMAASRGSQESGEDEDCARAVLSFEDVVLLPDGEKPRGRSRTDMQPWTSDEAITSFVLRILVSTQVLHSRRAQR